MHLESSKHILIDTKLNSLLNFKRHFNLSSLVHLKDAFKDLKDENFMVSTTMNIELSELKFTGNSSLKLSIKRDCIISFPPSCRISPYVKYWDEDADCFPSPLRNFSGSSQPIEDRKYVVFQPDLGGWNNIRMALEVVIVFAYVTGRILVLPPNAILYLLHFNKNWGKNKSNVKDYIDFNRLMNPEHGLEVITMEEFLKTVAMKGLLSKPLPNKDINLNKQPLWDYLESACYVRQWSPGKTFIGFNLSLSQNNQATFGIVSNTNSTHYNQFAIGRELQLYNESFHQNRAIYFPGHDKNRLLTHYYSLLYFADLKIENRVKRFVRDRLRYLDEIYCTASIIIEELIRLSGQNPENLDIPQYVSYHIRRGDFQQKHTRLEANDILRRSKHLIPNGKQRILYIATDEMNQTFFKPFENEFLKIYYLVNFTNIINFTTINPNHIGMIEQIVCSSADIFIGTPLSTFTSYITRIRGYMNSSYVTYPLVRNNLYNKTYYFMQKFMYQLNDKPRLNLPFWIREFADAFEGINEV